MNIYEKSLQEHASHKGKVAIKSKVTIRNKEELSIYYSPGVAAPCSEINKDSSLVYRYTSKQNTIGVISDGSAVLGLGNIGPLAAIPVMEGKAILFKNFANIDAIPICLDTQNTEEIIRTCKIIAPTLGGINLEDISAPRCIEIERRLIDELDIPVMHDDQHGTAIVVTAALINACKLANKEIKNLSVSLSGTGAAGSAIASSLKRLGVNHIYAYNIKGALSYAKYDSYDAVEKELLDHNIIDSYDQLDNDSLGGIIARTDVFIGVSVANIVTPSMISSMNPNPIVFALANPTPEIMPELAKEAGAFIVGTGRSDYPNQINNLLAFPGIFRGALDAKATKITAEMKLSASYAIASIIKENELTVDYIIPSPFDKRVVKVVSTAVKKQAIKQGLIRK
jgi:malate dehydrogenase (oxaloacetate-decarboxylating)